MQSRQGKEKGKNLPWTLPHHPKLNRPHLLLVGFPALFAITGGDPIDGPPVFGLEA